MLALTALALILTAGAGSTAAGVAHYEGAAYTVSGRMLYTESHWIAEDGRRLVLYRCPDGRPFARKWVSGGGGAAPDFELIDARSGYREGVRGRGSDREVFSTDDDGTERSAELPGAAAQVIDAGFDRYVRDHWRALLSGQDARIAFLMPSRQQNLALRIEPAGSGPGTRQFKLALDAWYGGLLPGFTVTYDAATRRLVRFEGLSNIRDAQGHYQKVRIEFPETAVGTAPQAQMQEASSAPLVGRCAA